MAEQDLMALMEKARRDDWHKQFVGSDIRMVIGRAMDAEVEIERLRVGLENIATMNETDDCERLRNTARAVLNGWETTEPRTPPATEGSK